MLDRETASKIVGIVGNRYYKKMLPFYKETLGLSRDPIIWRDPLKLLRLQIDLAKAETNLWKALREGRGLAKKLRSKPSLTDKEKKDLEGTENHIIIHQQIIRISRTICDGIAWRCLKYNRTFLNSAARGFGAGAIDIASRDFRSEFRWAYTISQRLGSVVIINDLTRFMRIGDLTEIKGNTVFIHEIKKFGKEVKNMFTLKSGHGKLLSRQAKRLLELQRIGLLNEAKIDGQTVKTRLFKMRAKTNIAKVKRLLRRSEHELIVTENIEPFITVEVTNFEAIGKKRDVAFEQLKTLIKPKPKGLYLVHSNWDAFFSDERGNFLRAVPPYSIFPLSVNDCLKLMSGQIMVKTTIDINKFKDELRRHGWEIEDTTEKDLDRQLAEFEKAKSSMFSSKESLYGQTPDEVGLFTVARGPFHLPIDTMIYGRLTMEYLSFESVLQLLEEMYRIASIRQSGDMYFLRFINEEKLWR